MRTFFKRVTSSVWGDVFIPSIDSYTKTRRLVAGAILGALAVIFQSAGVFTGIGYILSMMSTGPLVLASLLSFRIGMMTYFVTIFLLAIVQPTELLVFIFTTGLLGISLGFGFKYLRINIFIIVFAAVWLTLGISILLYGFKFAILGPTVTSHSNIIVILSTFAFSLFYSGLWKIISIFVFKILNKFFT